MIGRLRGSLVEKQPSQAILDVAGVGYELNISLYTFQALGDAGSQVELHVHTHVREEVLALYAFSSRIEKELFVRLLSVSGVGPKTAMALLSGLGPSDLLESVRGRDVKRLATAPGVGRKMAERIVLELADRLDTLGPALGEVAGGDGRDGRFGMRDDLISALVNLGYNARAASEAANASIKLAGGEPAPAFERLLKRALRTLAR